MADDRATSKDPLDALVFMIETGFTVAVRSVYKQSQFHLRAVQGERVLIAEDRDLAKALLKLRDDARRSLNNREQ
jgi:hypothetical protein